MLVDKNNPQDTILLKQDNSQSNQEEETTMSSSYTTTTPWNFILSTPKYTGKHHLQCLSILLQQTQNNPPHPRQQVLWQIATS